VEQNQLGMKETFHDHPCQLFHSDVSQSSNEWFQVLAAGHPTKSPFVQHKDSTLELGQGPEEQSLAHNQKDQATESLQ